MDKINFQDYLNYGESNEIQDVIGNKNILYSNRVIKLNKYNISREVDLILINQRIYILKKKSKKYILLIILSY